MKYVPVFVPLMIGGIATGMGKPDFMNLAIIMLLGLIAINTTK